MLPIQADLSWSPFPHVQLCTAAFSFFFSSYYILFPFCLFGLNHHLLLIGPDTHSLQACLSLCPSSNRVTSLSITLDIHLFLLILRPLSSKLALCSSATWQSWFKSKFLKREDNCRSVLGDHWKDKRVSLRAKRRLLQRISFQFPCAAIFKKWGWQESEECILCKALYLKQPAFAESLGHIQGYRKALQKPKIAVHHGIWRDLIRHIGKQSLEEHKDGSRIWTFPTSVSAVKHEEWEMREILTHMDLMTNTHIGRSDVGKEITLFHCTMGYWDADDLTDPKIQSFLKV